MVIRDLGVGVSSLLYRGLVIYMCMSVGLFLEGYWDLNACNPSRRWAELYIGMNWYRWIFKSGNKFK